MTQEQKLPPEFKAKWVAALRSGEYKQGQTNLFADNMYCCLGVACDISGVILNNRTGRCSYPTGLGNISNIESLPEMLRVPIATLSETTILALPMTRLARMNDSGKSFAEIADYIEQNL